MNKALERLFKPEQPTTILATIKSRISSGKYELIDDSGRVFTAISESTWPPKRRVLVQSGRIIRSVGSVGDIKTYGV